MRAGRTPYGRRCWLQSWCTVCSIHRYPLVAHRPRAWSGYETTWSADEMRQGMQFLAANGYRDLKVPSESAMRGVMLGSLLEIERAVADALRRCGLLTLSWPLAIRTHRIVQPVSLHKIARSHESLVQRPPAWNGWRIGRTAGHLHTRGNGGSTFPAVGRWQSRRSMLLLTQIFEIIDGNY